MNDFDDVDTLTAAWLSPKRRRINNERLARHQTIGLVSFVTVAIVAFTVFASPITGFFALLAGLMVSWKDKVTRLDTAVMMTFLIFIVAEMVAHLFAIWDAVWILMVIVAAALVFVWGFWK